MRKILLCALLGLFGTANARTYYFSTISGDDNRSSQAAQNPATPWQTINKLNTFYTNLQPGDVLMFKRGETFYGSIVITFLSGTASNPIVFGAYGSGSKPVITGLSSISNWTNIGNGIYEKSLSTQVTSGINMVTFQDSLQPIGRWPKTNTVGAGYLPFQSHSGTSSITSNKISSAPNFTGGELVTRAWGWIINRAKVTSQSSNVIRYTPLPSRDLSTHTYEPLDGFGFFFQNHINALTRLGDWMYDVNANKFRMYFGSQNPNNYSVNVATIDNLVNLNRQQYLTFDGLAFKGANTNSFIVDNSNNIVIKNCDISLSGIDGIFVRNETSGNITVKNCTIRNSNNNSITGNGSPRWIIQNNIINNTGINRGMGLSGDGQYIAINHVGSNSLVEFNDIKNTGYNGIEFDGDNTIIRNNFIDSFCVIKSDGGGIYNSIERDKRGRRVVGNIILNGIGDRFGRSQDEIDDPLAGNVHGIYMDGGASYVTIDSNTVANCGNSGIELSSTINVQVRNNTFYNNKVTQIYYWESKGPISNLTLKNNIAFSKSSEQLISLINADNDNERTWGIMDSNYYCRPGSEPEGVDTSGYSHSPSVFDYPDGGIIGTAIGRFCSLDKWKALSRQDLNSKKTPDNSYDLSKTRFEYNKTNNPKTIALNGSYYDVKNRLYNNTITISPYSSVILLKRTGPDPVDQTINFLPVPDKTFGDVPFSLNATASSGLSVSFRIVSGPGTLSGNTLTLTAPGIILVEASQAGNANYNPALIVQQTITVKDVVVQCSATGTILREEWDNIFGVNVSDIPLQSAPNKSGQISMLETQNTGEWMGARIRGYICAPISGDYTFYVSADDAADLYLSTDDNPQNKIKIAKITSWAVYHDWYLEASQKSSKIYLQANTRYYIEVLHKNGGGGDNVSVRWDLPNGTIEAPIAGSHLSPFIPGLIAQNHTINEHVLNDEFQINKGAILAFPNPFKYTQKIEVISLESGVVSLDVLDIFGRPVKNLFNGILQAGVRKSFNLTSTGLPNGIYSIRMQTKTNILTKQITLVK